MSVMSTFSPLQDDYLKTGNQDSWNKMFEIVVNNCKIKLGELCKLNGLKILEEDYVDYYMNAAVFIMGRYKKTRFLKGGGYKIKSIDITCYNAIRQVFQNPKEKAKSEFKKELNNSLIGDVNEYI